MSERPAEPRWSGGQVLAAWVVFAVGLAVAVTQVPPYLDSLDQRIVFANPDCMSVVADSQAALGLTVEERADSLTPWTRDCLRIREEVMLDHAGKVGWGATIGLVTLSILTFALTFAWGAERMRMRGRAGD